MAITITRSGYGYVEPNFISAPRTGQVRGDAPLSADAKTAIAASADGALMNGQFVVREADENGKMFTALANASSTNVWMVFNEEKLYDERKQQHKDFAMAESDYVDGVMVPRVIKILAGDTFTTNCFAQNTSLAVGDKLAVGANGMLVKTTADSPLVVTKTYTMPDSEPGVKVEAVANL